MISVGALRSLFVKERNAKRLVYRLIENYGPLDYETICFMCSAIYATSGLCRSGILPISETFQVFSIEYSLNLNLFLKELIEMDYVGETPPYYFIKEK